VEVQLREAIAQVLALLLDAYDRVDKDRLDRRLAFYLASLRFVRNLLAILAGE